MGGLELVNFLFTKNPNKKKILFFFGGGGMGGRGEGARVSDFLLRIQTKMKQIIYFLFWRAARVGGGGVE